jgi:hypothetical protein
MNERNDQPSETAKEKGMLELTTKQCVALFAFEPTGAAEDSF